MSTQVVYYQCAFRRRRRTRTTTCLTFISGTNLLQTAAHEFGHSLGLSHSDKNEALMAPFYRGFESKPKLNEDDIKAIQVRKMSGRVRSVPGSQWDQTCLIKAEHAYFFSRWRKNYCGGLIAQNPPVVVPRTVHPFPKCPNENRLSKLTYPARR